MSRIVAAAAARPPSPLMLADRLLTMAQDTERAGYALLAERLLGMAMDVLEEPAPLH